MAKHIMLLFLSVVQIDRDTGKIRETTYKNISRNMEGEITLTTNESAVRYILYNGGRGSDISRIYIFASETVRKNFNYEFEDGKKRTHLQFFKERIGKFIPNIDEVINKKTIIDYKENGSPNDNLLIVAKMAGLIQEFVDQANEEVILHVDFTGGLRNVNMMMLDVIRLLEYSGVKIGSLLYSNYQNQKVEPVKNIYNFFQLISGVEEFVQFGSVKVLEKYYATSKNKISASLQNLIDAMKSFSEEIKLCHYGRFIESVQKLHDAINDFKPTPNNLQDSLMNRLIDRIREEYSMLINTRGEDDLQIIRWCVEKGYFQQALTLYTERIPEVLSKRKIITMTPDENEKLQRAMRGDKRAQWFYLINKYLDNDIKGKMLSNVMTKKRDELQERYIELIKEALELIRQQQFDYDSWYAPIPVSLENKCAESQKIFNEPDYYSYARTSAVEMTRFNYDIWYNKIIEFVDVLKIKIPSRAKLPIEDGEFILENETRLKNCLNLLNKIKQNPKMLETLDTPELESLKEIFDFEIEDDKTIKSELEKIRDIQKRVKKLLGLIRDNAGALFKDINFKRSLANFRIYDMHANGIFEFHIDEKVFFSIINKYFLLKEERNHSNHASHDLNEFTSTDALKKYMLEALDEIEKAEVKAS